MAFYLFIIFFATVEPAPAHTIMDDKWKYIFFVAEVLLGFTLLHLGDTHSWPSNFLNLPLKFGAHAHSDTLTDRWGENNTTSA